MPGPRVTAIIDDDLMGYVTREDLEAIAIATDSSPFDAAPEVRTPTANSRPRRTFRSRFGGLTLDEGPQPISEELNEMSTIGQIYSLSSSSSAGIEAHPLIQGKGLVGIEVELEGITERMPRSSYWNQIHDGSLRNNGKEYVMQRPLGGVELNTALTELEQHLQLIELDDSWRCSTHVHVDVRGMTESQVRKFILGYAVHELLIFKCSGFHRYKNNFCMPLGFAQQQIQHLASNWHREGRNLFDSVLGSWNKYTAMNLLPLSYQGSIEFRMSEPKWRKGHLVKLVNRFLAIQEEAIAHEGSEEEFVTMIANVEAASEMFKKGLPRGIHPNIDDTEFGWKLAMDVLQTASLTSKSVALLLRGLSNPEAPIQTMDSNSWRHLREMVNIGSDHWRSNMFGLTEETFTRDCNLTFLQVRRVCQLAGLRSHHVLEGTDNTAYRTWLDSNSSAITTILQNI